MTNLNNLNQSRRTKKTKKKFVFSIEKRHKFVAGSVLLALGLFFSELQFGRASLVVPFFLAIFSAIFLYWAIYRDLLESRSYEVFILPFLYSLSFGLFYFLTPASFLFRLFLGAVYGFGLYSIFLSQNIMVISSVRTITLLSGARIVSFVIALLSYFFLTNIVFTIHKTVFIYIPLIFTFSYLLIYHSLWTYSLNNILRKVLRSWSIVLTLCLVEASVLLWFWPSSPTFIALFLTGFFYAITGLSHIWFEKRFFKGVLWEYVWVGCIVFFVLVLFTPWGK